MKNNESNRRENPTEPTPRQLNKLLLVATVAVITGASLSETGKDKESVNEAAWRRYRRGPGHGFSYPTISYKRG